MNIREHLELTVAGWESIGSPALLERFVLRNGKVYTGTPKPANIPWGQPKNCYGNSTKASLDHRLGAYVEGFTDGGVNAGILIQHAWLGLAGDKALDLTLKPDLLNGGPRETIQYMGVEFTRKQVRQSMLDTGFYGLLDTGRGLNLDLIFEVDPELREIVRAAGRKHLENSAQFTL